MEIAVEQHKMVLRTHHIFIHAVVLSPQRIGHSSRLFDDC